MTRLQVDHQPVTSSWQGSHGTRQAWNTTTGFAQSLRSKPERSLTGATTWTHSPPGTRCRRPPLREVNLPVCNSALQGMILKFWRAGPYSKSNEQINLPNPLQVCRDLRDKHQPQRARPAVPQKRRIHPDALTRCHGPYRAPLAMNQEVMSTWRVALASQ
jgi:hypothetical protein